MAARSANLGIASGPINYVSGIAINTGDTWNGSPIYCMPFRDSITNSGTLSKTLWTVAPTVLGMYGTIKQADGQQISLTIAASQLAYQAYVYVIGTKLCVWMGSSVTYTITAFIYYI